jgi:hypothetical protein
MLAKEGHRPPPIAAVSSGQITLPSDSPPASNVERRAHPELVPELAPELVPELVPARLVVLAIGEV